MDNIVIISKDELRQVVADAMRMNTTPITKENDGYYTTNDMCKLLHITRVTLWRLRKDGLITGVKVGKKNLYDKTYVNDLIAAGKLG